MVRTINAIYKQGVLVPLEDLKLAERQRVQIIVEPVGATQPLEDRGEAVKAFLAGVRRSTFRSSGRYPTRDELHDRRE